MVAFVDWFAQRNVFVEGLNGLDPVAREQVLAIKFRTLVSQRLGTLATCILDWRINRRDLTELVGMPELGSPTVNKIKREIQKLKRLADDFAVQHGGGRRESS